MTFEVTIKIGGKEQSFRVELEAGAANGALLCRVNGVEETIDATLCESDVLSLILGGEGGEGGESFEIRRDLQGGQAGEMRLVVAGDTFQAEVRDPRSLRSRRGAAARAEGPRKITAPMPGKVVRILAPAGAAVEAGQGVIVIEAMKMQNELKSPKQGVVKKINVAEGDTVNPGDALAVVE